MKNKPYTTGDFGRDLKKAHIKPSKKKKTAMPMVRKVMTPAGGTTQKLMNSAISKARVVGAPPFKGAAPAAMNAQNPAWANTPNAMAKKSKKMKEKSSKKKSSKKEKVSHVLQESSMCKECKTSHPKGKHMKTSGVKKKR